MDKKKIVKYLPPEDLKGFEEFIENVPGDTSFLPKPTGQKKEVSFEHFTFLTDDSERLLRIKNLLSKKVPFSTKYKQGQGIVNEQQEELKLIRQKLFEMADKQNSTYRKSLDEMFGLFFDPSKTKV